MPDDPGFRTVLDERYRELVRMAYLVLPGEFDPHDRLVLAHWIVHHSVPRRAGERRGEDPYERLRRRVLLRAMRPPSPRRARLGPWLRAVPAAGSAEEQVLTSALAGLDPHARAAYVLRHLESLPDAAVREQLAWLGVPDPDTALRAVASLDSRIPPQIQAVLLGRPPLDPTISRLHRRARPSHTRAVAVASVGAASALLLAAAAVQVTVEPPDARQAVTAAQIDRAYKAARRDRVTLVDPGQWRRTTRFDLGAWPARGDLIDDGDFVQEALAAWHGSVRARPYDQAVAVPLNRPPQLLYAGTVGTSRVALLHDDGRVARYTARGDQHALEVFPEGRVLDGESSPLKLAPGRYLVPPWVTEVRSAVLGGRPAWKRITVRGGVTDPVPRAPAGDCWRGPVLNLRQPEFGAGHPYTMVDLGGLNLANIAYEPAPTAVVQRTGPVQLDESSRAGFRLWGRLGCALPATSQAARAALTGRTGGVEAAGAWEFWAGDLPDRGGRGHWVCTRFTFADGRSASYATLLTPRRAQATGERTDSWDCSGLRRDVASGTWWKSPGGRWHYLAAASRGVTILAADGRFATRPVVDYDFLVARAAAGPRPRGPVEINARNYANRPVPVFQGGER